VWTLLKGHHLLPAYWLTLAVVILVCDYLTGPFIRFPILFLVPIALASRYSGRWWGIGLAVGMPVVRLWAVHGAGPPEDMIPTTMNAFIRMVVLVGFAFLIDRTTTQQRLLAREARALSGLLPICSYCKKIRNADGGWQPLEVYISQHSEALLSHSFCPDCMRARYGNRVPPP